MSTFDPEPILAGLEEAVPTILAETVGLPARPAGRRIESHPVVTQGVTVLVGVVGDLEGYVLLSMSPDFACRLTARLLGLEIERWDEMVDSAVGELGNMVTGQTSMILHRMGVDCELCPPTILLSEKVELGGAITDLAGVTFKTEWGNFDARVSLQPVSEPEASHPCREATPGPVSTGICDLALRTLIETEALVHELATELRREDLGAALERARIVGARGDAAAAAVPVLLAREAERRRDGGDRDAFETLCRTALELDPDCRPARVQLARAHLEVDRPGEALTHWQAILEADPLEGSAWYWSAVCKDRMGDVPTALLLAERGARRGAGPKAERLADELRKRLPPE